MERNPLNSSEVDGNVSAWLADRDRERKDDGDAPQYHCGCGEFVPEEEWICELEMCKECYEEHYGGSFVSPDQDPKCR